MDNIRLDFGEYLFSLRTKHGYSQKKVADKLGIDISLLSKIEHGERHIQGHMLKPLSELFKLDYKKIQIIFLNQKIVDSFGDEPYFFDAVDSIRR